MAKFEKGTTVKISTGDRIFAVICYVIVALFALFYPVISGKPISLEFAETWLKWFSSWVLVA